MQDIKGVWRVFYTFFLSLNFYLVFPLQRGVNSSDERGNEGKATVR